MILNIKEAICKETVDKITIAINNLQPKEKLFIYFSSEGGDVDSGEAIISIINNNVDLIELAGYGDIMSCGFDIFFRSKCNRILLPGVIGMYHQGTITVTMNESEKIHQTRDKADKEWASLQKIQTIKLCNLLKMTDKEINQIKRGRDVYFQYPRMLDFLNTKQK